MEFSDYADGVRAIHERFSIPWTPVPDNSEGAVAAAEAGLGFPLQPGLRAAWKAADGSGTASLFIRPGYLTTYAFLPLADALEERESRRRIAPNYEGYENPEPRDPRIRPGWFQEGWVPFASFAEGTALLMADHSPAEGGQVGQVIAYTHDPDEISYVAPDWPTFLQLSLQEITADPEEFLEIGF